MRGGREREGVGWVRGGGRGRNGRKGTHEVGPARLDVCACARISQGIRWCIIGKGGRYGVEVDEEVGAGAEGERLDVLRGDDEGGGLLRGEDLHAVGYM